MQQVNTISDNINKFGTAGIILTALLSPCCFPLFALGASALGFGSFELFGGWTMWIFQAMVLISVAGLFISYRKHRSIYPLLIAIPAAALILYGYHLSNSDHWDYFLYAGMAGLLIATAINYHRFKFHGNRNTPGTYNGRVVELQSTLTCPNCGHKKEEIMPTDACTYYYECENCKARLKPLPGDCCVYCSYGSVKCPPIQAGEECC